MPNPVEQDIAAALLADATIASLCGARVKPLVLDQGTAYPAITYQRIATVRTPGQSYTLGNGYGGFAWARFQFDCWAKRYSDAIAMGAAVVKVVHALALGGSAPCNTVLMEMDASESIDASQTLCRRIVDAKIWFRESI